MALILPGTAQVLKGVALSWEHWGLPPVVKRALVGTWLDLQLERSYSLSCGQVNVIRRPWQAGLAV
jgi:hypothetical protein